jgi:D-alanyl-D-alanine dipeptidase
MHVSNKILWVVVLFFVGCAKQVSFDFSEKGTGMKELTSEHFIVDLRYNSENNFLKRNVYRQYGLDKCYVHPDLHDKLMKLEKNLIAKKLKLVIYDCFRPLQVQEEMWKLIPDENYVADPKKGSNHNRGVAIDCALADESGRTLPFPTDFDDFSERASHAYVCGDLEREGCKNRELLASLMKEVGLEIFPSEWWHYQLPDAKKYPIVSVQNVVKQTK